MYQFATLWIIFTELTEIKLEKNKK